MFSFIVVLLLSLSRTGFYFFATAHFQFHNNLLILSKPGGQLSTLNSQLNPVLQAPILEEIVLLFQHHILSLPPISHFPVRRAVPHFPIE